MSQWSFGRSAFAARAAADAARRENTKPLQRPSETLGTYMMNIPEKPIQNQPTWKRAPAE